MKPILIIIGPSGVGKSSVISSLRAKKRVELVPTWTTRRPRSYEHENLADHVFVDADTFVEKEQQGYFMACTSLFGLDYRYGLPDRCFWQGDGVHVVMLRAMLMEEITRYFSDYRIYQIEAPVQRVREHMLHRKLEEGDIGSRLDGFNKEVVLGRNIADRVIENDGHTEQTAEKIWSYICQDFNLDEVVA